MKSRNSLKQLIKTFGEKKTVLEFNLNGLTDVVIGNAPTEVAQADINKDAAADDGIPAEYLNAHQASAPSASAYYIQTVSY